jgi:hypothetical protein
METADEEGNNLDQIWMLGRITQRKKEEKEY